MQNGELPKRIDLSKLSAPAREKILAVLLREQAAKLVTVTDEELRLARAYVQGERGGKDNAGIRSAFTKVMTKLIVEDGNFKQGVSKRLGALGDVARRSTDEVIRGMSKPKRSGSRKRVKRG